MFACAVRGLCCPLVLAVLAAAVVAGEASGQALPAFPGAEGAGATASGGRGYDVYHVTNLNDSGAGSFRDAVSAGNRLVVFDVGGTITLGPDATTNTLTTSASNITIAGQTAPGDGIFVYGQGLKLTGSNVIVRNLHMRPGEDAFGRSGDGISFDATGSIIDHCSVEWATDEGLSGWHPGYDNTVQYTVVSEALNYAGHGYGSLVGSDEPNVTLSYHHNLYAHNKSRNPRLGNEAKVVNVVDWRNNVMYNWESNCGYSSGGGGGNYAWGNFVGNYYGAGNSTSSGDRAEAFSAAGTFTHLYQSGNKIDPNINGAFDGADTGWGMFTGVYVAEASELPAAAVHTQTAADALQTVLSYVGADWWNRDSVDARIVNDVITCGGTIKNWTTDVGGLTYYPEVHRPGDFDTDSDGMPNTWEIAHGLDPNTADQNGDHDLDGYTNIEEYVNELAAFPAPKPIVFIGGGLQYERISSWDIPWQPSSLDAVEINSGRAHVSYLGQAAGTMRVGNSPGGTGGLAMLSGGGLTVADSIHVGAAAGAGGTVDVYGGVLRAGGKLHLGSVGMGTLVQTGGSCAMGGGVVIADGPTSRGLYDLRGGALRTTQLAIGSGFGEFRFTGGTLSADEVAFDLTNAGGLLAPGDSTGATHVIGDLTLTDGAMEIELASLLDFDKVIVDGLATLGGDLQIKLLGGYTPQLNDTWEILAAGSFTGGFDSVTDGFLVDAVGNDLVLTAVPEPAALSLLVAGACLLLRKRRPKMRKNVILIGLLAVFVAGGSTTQAAVVNTYNFDSLTTGDINGKTGEDVTWRSISGNVDVFEVVVDPNDAGNKYVDSMSSSLQEQSVGTMADPNSVSSVFNLTPADTLVRVSFTSRMNYAAGGMVGIWVDGIDPSVNSMETSNQELVCQFGMSGGQWRVRGANGSPSVLDATGMPPSGQMPWLKVTLDMDLTANGGDGSMSLSFVDLATSAVTAPSGLQNVSMSLLSQDSRLGDPTQWTGWWFRGQQSALAENPAVCPYGYTIDDLTLEVIPEPTTLGLLAAAGLAMLRRRGRRS